MFCTRCGGQLGSPEPNYCPSCGAQTSAGQAQFRPPYQRRLERPLDGGKIGGVCAAFANYMDVDVTLIRVLAVIALFFSVGTAFIAYIIAMIVIPKEQPRPMGDTVRVS